MDYRSNFYNHNQLLESKIKNSFASSNDYSNNLFSNNPNIFPNNLQHNKLKNDNSSNYNNHNKNTLPEISNNYTFNTIYKPEIKKSYINSNLIYKDYNENSISNSNVIKSFINLDNYKNLVNRILSNQLKERKNISSNNKEISIDYNATINEFNNKFDLNPHHEFEEDNKIKNDEKDKNSSNKNTIINNKIIFPINNKENSNDNNNVDNYVNNKSNLPENTDYVEEKSKIINDKNDEFNFFAIDDANKKYRENKTTVKPKSKKNDFDMKDMLNDLHKEIDNLKKKKDDKHQVNNDTPIPQEQNYYDNKFPIQCYKCAYINFIDKQLLNDYKSNINDDGIKKKLNSFKCENCSVSITLDEKIIEKPFIKHRFDMEEIETDFVKEKFYSNLIEIQCTFCKVKQTLKKGSKYAICNNCYNTILISQYDNQNINNINQILPAIVNPYHHQSGIKTKEQLVSDDLSKQKAFEERVQAYQPRYYFKEKDKIEQQNNKLFDPQRDYVPLHLEFERFTKKLAEKQYGKWKQELEINRLSQNNNLKRNNRLDLILTNDKNCDLVNRFSVLQYKRKHNYL